MFKHTIKLILVGALLAIGVMGPGSRSEASVVLNTPAGLTNGDQFRFVFVTPGTRDATSTIIGDYNTFVNTQAGGATYGGTVINWYAIATTSTVNAKDNILGSPTTPVYLSVGTKVANDLSATAGGLWGGTLLVPINYTLTSGPTYQSVWTGTDPEGGMGFGGIRDLGSTFPTTGSSSQSDQSWAASGLGYPSETNSLYGISEVLTAQTSAVPEPSTYALLCVSLGVIGYARKKMVKSEE